MADNTKPRRNVREDLEILEHNITRLKMEYEQYFMRVLKREPLFLRGQVDKTIAFYTNQYIKNTADKFKFRNLADKYTSFKQYWIRTLKAIENGTYHRRSEGSNIKMAGGPPHQTSPAQDRTKEAPYRNAPSPKQNKVEEEKELREVYNNYISEMKKINEPTDNISFDFMKKAVGAQKRKAEERYGTSELNFKIKSADGKVKIQIIPKK